MAGRLSEKEKKTLLKVAREAIISAINGLPPNEIDISNVSANLRSKGASFVTLTINGKLRGCIGALEAYQPLVLDVQEHAAAAAMEDYRFNQVSIEEIPSLKIEISWLTPTVKLDYSDGKDLLSKLRPEIDGVLIKDGSRRATFLPQVWEQIPNSEEFLSRLCMKMGSPPDLWYKKNLDVFIYQVEEFKEE